MSSTYHHHPSYSGLGHLSELGNQSINESYKISTTQDIDFSPAYERVHVLVCDWEVDQRLEQEYPGLQDAFRNVLTGVVDTFSIPKRNGLESLRAKALDIVHKSVGYNLVILYYSGDAESLNGRFVLSP